MDYRLTYSEDVIRYIIEEVHSERVFEQIEHARKVIESMPSVGRVYDPEYPAAKLPFPCRMFAVPSTPFTLYYSVDEALKEICIFYIEHQRANPEERFLYASMPF